jgi:hypothetical protein
MQYKYWMVHSVGNGATNKIHETCTQAVEEAKRLSVANPGKRFAVLEVVRCFEVKQPEPVEVRVERMPISVNR